MLKFVNVTLALTTSVILIFLMISGTICTIPSDPDEELTQNITNYIQLIYANKGILPKNKHSYNMRNYLIDQGYERLIKNIPTNEYGEFVNSMGIPFLYNINEDYIEIVSIRKTKGKGNRAFRYSLR